MWPARSVDVADLCSLKRADLFTWKELKGRAMGAKRARSIFRQKCVRASSITEARLVMASDDECLLFE